MNLGIALLGVFAVLVSGFAINDAFAISPNQSIILEGSGYLATEQTIKISDFDIILETGAQTGSKINVSIDNGFVTIDGDDYLITDSSATSLREGKYIRISATAESPDDGDEITISTLGRLIQNSQEGSIYTFTGRVVEGSTEFKIIYIGQLSNLSPSTTSTNQQPVGDETLTVRIVEGASNSDLTSSYIGSSPSQVAGYFSQDRLTITPGTSVIFVNDDVVEHTLVSGTGLAGSRITGDFVVCEGEEELNEGSSYSQNNCDFTLDGRLNSGVIAPGDSWTTTFEEMGFYRIIDVDYPWMNIVVYNFPESDTLLIRQGNNPLGN